MTRFKIIFILSFFILNRVAGQNYSTFYALDNNKQLHEVTISASGCSSSVINYDISCMAGKPLSIALDGSTLYSIDNKGNLYTTALGAASSCTFVTSFSFNTAPTNTVYGLMVDKTGIVYAASGNDISYYDPVSGILTKVPGTLPSAIGGDLVFYLGDLYMLTNDNPSNLLKVNLGNLSNSIVATSLTGYTDAFGITSIAVKCKNSQVYILSTPTSSSTNIVPIDIQTGNPGAIFCSLPFQTYDAASISEGDAYVQPQLVTHDQDVCLPATVDLTLPRVTAGSSSGLISFSYWKDAAITIPYTTPTNAVTGKYYIVGATVDGCKDTESVAVAIVPVSSDTTAANCINFNWYGTNYNSSTTATHTLKNILGCDSVITLHLTINQPSSGDTTVTICGNFTWYGTNYTSSAIATHLFKNSKGCDSIVTLHLTINQPNTGDTTATACGNFTWYETNYTSSATPTHLFKNSKGCDSVVTLHLTINQPNTGDTTATACSNFIWYGTNYTSSATPTHLFKNNKGCDSIVTLHLTIGQLSRDTAATACNNFTWYGTNYTFSSSPTHIFKSSTGCDSLVTLHLTINQPSTSDTTVIACSNFTWYGINYTSSATPTHLFKNSKGCDSIVTLHLTINQPNTGDTIAIACSNFTWYGINYSSSSTATHLFKNSKGCDSIVTLHLTINQPSTGDTSATACNNFIWYGINYTLSSTPTHLFKNSKGCDSIVTLHLTINQPSRSDTFVTVCNNFVWYGTDYTSGGTTTHLFKNIKGCDSTVTLHLNISQPGTTFTTVHVCPNELPYRWNNNAYSTDGTYTIKFTGVDGCDSVATLVLSTVIDCDDIFFPTAFSPNNDGSNDKFGAIGDLYNVKDFQLKIFNRWGQMVFSTTDPFGKWDGTYTGEMQDAANFVWYASYVYRDKKKTKKGNVALIR